MTCTTSHLALQLGWKKFDENEEERARRLTQKQKRRQSAKMQPREVCCEINRLIFHRKCPISLHSWSTCLGVLHNNKKNTTRRKTGAESKTKNNSVIRMKQTVSLSGYQVGSSILEFPSLQILFYAVLCSKRQHLVSCNPFASYIQLPHLF